MEEGGVGRGEERRGVCLLLERVGDGRGLQRAPVPVSVCWSCHSASLALLELTGLVTWLHAAWCCARARVCVCGVCVHACVCVCYVLCVCGVCACVRVCVWWWCVYMMVVWCVYVVVVVVVVCVCVCVCVCVRGGGGGWCVCVCDGGGDVCVYMCVCVRERERFWRCD